MFVTKHLTNYTGFLLMVGNSVKIVTKNYRPLSFILSLMVTFTYFIILGLA